MTKPIKQIKCESCQKPFKTYASSSKSVCNACGSFSEFNNVKWLPKNIDIDKVLPVANHLISNLSPDIIEDIEKILKRMERYENLEDDLELRSRLKIKRRIAKIVLEDAVNDGLVKDIEPGTHRLIELAKILNQKVLNYYPDNGVSKENVREKRLADLESMVKAGIPRRIVNYWVEGLIEKSTMFHALNLFGNELEKVEDVVARCVLNRGIQFTEKYTDSKQRLDFVHDTYTHYPASLVIYSSSNELKISQLEFLKECWDSIPLQNLYIHVTENDFDIELAQKCIKEYGFDKHPSAMDEVVNGANWEAVAAKHGFLQY